MKKIPTLFVRDSFNSGSVLPTVTAGCEWALSGEAVATRKRDGLAVLVRGPDVFKRHDAKHGKTLPDGFEPCQEPDGNTGHWPGWVPIDPVRDHLIVTGVANTRAVTGQPLADGTYELCGPQIGTRAGNNPERLDKHILFRHGEERLSGFDLSFDGIRQFLSDHIVEGIVFHHPDGRMAKVKTRDFGLEWPREPKERTVKLNAVPGSLFIAHVAYVGELDDRLHTFTIIVRGFQLIANARAAVDSYVNRYLKPKESSITVEPILGESIITLEPVSVSPGK